MKTSAPLTLPLFVRLIIVHYRIWKGGKLAVKLDSCTSLDCTQPKSRENCLAGTVKASRVLVPDNTDFGNLYGCKLREAEWGWGWDGGKSDNKRQLSGFRLSRVGNFNAVFL